MNAATTFGPRISGWARKVPTWPIYLIGLAPAIWLIWAGTTGGLGVDPVKAMEHRAGLWSLQLLLASLCVTPLMRFARINLIKFRKPLGLLAFGYLVLHFLIWLVLDMALRWDEIARDLVKRPYIVVGFAAFVILVPVAATSWQGAIRRMGQVAWQRLHRLVYLAVLLGAVHFVMQEKVWTVEAIAYLIGTTLLVGMRFLWVRRW
ncbi:protein-methionine-sulfoxide reductase heme-binding subunit MsrQ [Jannaschia sp. LMIT008]|uniref:protein-methionine-sulfoxide reductase heme-binding subunit MsrQ n=1 Tax=Jannaschia maritima TaxID=3032585 RepID=UPI0028115EAC|nr:protein-methionine-sulfoxide reductase heme-binding subunit MsrQ [Jannaschia sp. LMIT008]